MSADIESLRRTNRKPSAADKQPIKISESSGHQGRVVNKNMQWGKLCDKLCVPRVDNVTKTEYAALSVSERHKRKNQGYFVGGHFKEGARKVRALESRTLLTLDMDECSPRLADELLNPLDGWLSDYEYFVYSTRSHTREAPRLRVIIPLSEPVTLGAFPPLTRIVAHSIDPPMRAVDPVSYRPAQIMYLPSINSDGVFDWHHHHGEIMDPATVLASFGDQDFWSNYANLPRSDREKNLREIGTKVQPAREKRGIVGALCRTYTIPEFIEKYLADIYEPGEVGADDTERWTYKPGSTSNGVVLYEDQTYAYSWHGTDPCADKLVNAFDMGRLHLFGHLDKPEDLTEGETDPRKLPSYQKMVEFCLADRAVAMEQTRSLYDQQAMAADSIFETDDEDENEPPASPGSIVAASRPEVASVLTTKRAGTEVTSVVALNPAKTEVTPQQPVRDWMEDLDRNDKGGIKNTLHNVEIILLNDKRFAGALAYNEFTEDHVIVRRIRAKQYERDTGPITSKDNGDLLTEDTANLIRAVLEGPRGDGLTGWGLKVSERDLAAGISLVCRRNRFHPVRRYMQAVKWDGVPRVRKMLATYWHAERSSYTETVGYLVLLGVVARVFEPGHKFDFVLILEGLQGIRKSTSIGTICGPNWFAELTADVHDTNKVIENIKGKLVVEIPELVAMMKGDPDVLKALFSATTDRARLAYGRGAKDYPRQTVFVGTTNSDEYFKDTTGNRRYWPVKLSGLPIDVEGLARDRDQIWAEVYQFYCWLRRQHPDKSVPLPLFLPDAERRMVEAMQERRMIVGADDGLKGQIESWLNTPVPASQAAAGWRPKPFADGLDDADEDEQKLLRQETCIRDVMHFCLGMEQNRQHDDRTSRQVGRILSSIEGWKRQGNKRLGRPLGVQVIWVRNEDL